MFDVLPGDTLFQVTFYEVFTQEGTVTIKLQEALTESVYKFTAVPFNYTIEAEEQYVGRGATAEEALNSCLGRIRNVAVASLFPERQLW